MKFDIVYTRESEHERLKFTLGKLDFYKEKGHKVNLPKGVNSPNEDTYRVLSAADREFPDQTVIEAKETIQLGLKRYADAIDKYIRSLPFKAPDKVTLILTRYGAGGSYNVTASEIIINVNYDIDLLSLLVHELTHLLVDDALVTKLSLSHEAKENLIKWLLNNSLVLKDFIKIPTRAPIEAPGRDVLDELKKLDYTSI